MAQVADPKLPCVKLEAKEARLTVSAGSAHVGDGSEEMDMDHEGDDVRVAVNVRYLMDALRAIDGQQQTVLETFDPREPAKRFPVVSSLGGPTAIGLGGTPPRGTALVHSSPPTRKRIGSSRVQEKNRHGALGKKVRSCRFRYLTLMTVNIPP